VDALDAELDALAAADLHDLTPGQLLDRTALLVARCNRMQAELARTARAAELAQAPEHDGLKSMASWLRGHGRLSGRAAKAVVRGGRVLAQLPAVAAGCAAGVVSAEQVGVIAPVVSPEAVARAEAQGVDLGEVDAVLAGVAATQSYDRLRQVVHHYLARLDPDGPEPDPTEGRALSFVKHDDGSIGVRGELDAVGGEKLQAALESILQVHRPKGDTRTRSQMLADALVQLCDNALATGPLPITRGSKPQVLVTIGVEDLLAPATGPATAQAGFGAVISAARARWAACDANVSRVVLGPDGQPLDLGHRPRCRGPRRACEAWGAARSFHSPAAAHPITGATSTT
jgi:hypothetical protein